MEDLGGEEDRGEEETTDSPESDEYQTESEFSDDWMPEPPIVSDDVRGIEFFLDTSFIEEDVVNPKFARYLIERATARITGSSLPSVMATEYKVTLYGEPYRTDEGVLAVYQVGYAG